MKHDRLTALGFACLLALTPVSAGAGVVAADIPADVTSLAESIPAQTEIADAGVELLDHSVHYPQLTGMADEALQARINEQIKEIGQIEALLERLPLVLSLSTPLKADYRAEATGDVFSCAMSALGPVFNGRPTQVWHTLNVDLTTGEPITLADLFEDEAAALDAIEACILEEIAPTLSAHLQNSAITPLPEDFTVSAEGLTFYYPIDQLSTLSDRAGAIRLQWCELTGLDLADGGVLDRIGAIRALTLDDASLSCIAEAVSAGQLPGIPVRLEDSMQAATDAYRMLIDPDLCEAGRLFSLEDDRFRKIYLITDALGRSWENSVVQGIRADNINFYGLCTGVTTQDAWRAVLGKPALSVALDAERAEAWRLPEGVSDYYVFGEHRLRLHADENGVLFSVFLTP